MTFAWNASCKAVRLCARGILACDILSRWHFILWHFVYVAFCLVTFCLWEILCCDVLSCGVLSCDILSCGNLSCCIMSGNQTKWFVCVEGWNILGQWGDDSFAINHSKFFSFKGWFPTPRLLRPPVYQLPESMVCKLCQGLDIRLDTHIDINQQ